jgi:type IV pilus assembly protein PilZ
MGQERDDGTANGREHPLTDDVTDRRLSDRIHVTWAVDCETEDTFLYASITNISAMGIFVQTMDPLAVGTEVTLRFTPPSSPEGFILRGLVQWINRPVGGSPNPGMGIRFAELTLDDRERIVDAIHTIAYLREDPARN